MTRKATEQVTTIGIDIGKNTLHLIGLEGYLGSHLAVKGLAESRPLLRIEQTQKMARSGTALIPL